MTGIALSIPRREALASRGLPRPGTLFFNCTALSASQFEDYMRKKNQRSNEPPAPDICPWLMEYGMRIQSDPVGRPLHDRYKS